MLSTTRSSARSFILICFLLFSCTYAWSNRYVYIQGDKQMPFVVAVEGYNLPKLGKHYCIIPNLEPGTINVVVTFQSQDIPAHKFLIQVPEHSSRGLILTKVSGKEYALFDMQTQAYLSNNNTEDIAFLEFDPSTHRSFVSRERTKISERQNTAPEILPYLSKENRKDNNEAAEESTPEEETVTRSPFLEDLDLNNSKRYKQKNTGSDTYEEGTTSATSVNNKKKKVAYTHPGNPDQVFIEHTEPEAARQTASSDPRICETALTNEQFENFSARYVNFKDDTEKLKYIRKNKDKHCFSTSQVQILANFLEGQSAKFELLDMMKGHVADKNNYIKLQNIFSSDFMKEKFLKSLK